MNKDYIDTDFKEVDKDKLDKNDLDISSLYLNCKQVSQIVGENESTIRYWVKQFDDILNIQTSNSIKKYTKTDVDNLLFIKKLIREDGMTIKQTYDYCSTKGLKNTEDIIDMSNPLAIKTVIKAIMTEFNDTIKENIIDEIKNSIKDNNEILKEELSLTLDEVINDKMNELSNQNEELQNIIESINNNLEEFKKETEQIQSLQQKMLDRKEEYEKKSWFKKIFKY